MLHEAVLSDNVEMVDYLLKSYPELSSTFCANGRTAQHLAAFLDTREEIVRLLMRAEKGMSAACDANGRTVADLASAHSFVDWSTIARLYNARGGNNSNLIAAIKNAEAAESKSSDSLGMD